MLPLTLRPEALWFWLVRSARRLEPLHLVHSVGEGQLCCAAGLLLWCGDTAGLGWSGL